MSLFWVALGAVLTVCAIAGVVDSYWHSFGISLLGVGGMQLWRQRRYRKDEAYREKVDTETQDERNRFIANKAWAWAGYLFVMIASVGGLAFKIAGREDLMMFCFYSVCLLMLLYWGSYMVLKRKY
jgi:uncharacterized membrane protein